MYWKHIEDKDYCFGRKELLLQKLDAPEQDISSLVSVFQKLLPNSPDKPAGAEYDRKLSIQLVGNTEDDGAPNMVKITTNQGQQVFNNFSSEDIDQLQRDQPFFPQSLACELPRTNPQLKSQKKSQIIQKSFITKLLQK
eukprot:Platyproteum_vivax@DN7280_c0_g1_i2.p1